MSSSTVIIKDGAVYLSSDVYTRFFDRLESVILLRRDRDLCILPVRHSAAGGYLLKMRNKAGDRVVHAPDFFRESGSLKNLCTEFAAEWSSTHGALMIAGAFEV
ncbi:hypothetical protein [Bradyrhizobium iriomotense]|uniref:Uncharacterized protein n=1 Tax=Bradyrhizobium iriomotense TaxID=441950 RepID=A0ABQ6ANT9_9BRAD|nr:hypothetical protein [Bradyrhizobium iriomotense]GLR83759.1 hypothetical protein GCM10007857_04690 [Bradyrhizobium iriomotense]